MRMSMHPSITHSWDLSESEATRLQRVLASKVTTHDEFAEIGFVAGADVAYAKESETLVSAVVVLDAATLEIVETVTAEDIAQFPYIPGLFSFRELPALAKALARIQQKPDLVVCDGQGIAHPRRFGLASHLGVLFDVPTIGCGKTRLVGKHQEPGKERGASEPLIDRGEVVGRVLRTQTGVKPVYVSVGHRISLKTACDWILKLSPKYRLPETTRQADHAVRMALKAKEDLEQAPAR